MGRAELVADLLAMMEKAALLEKNQAVAELGSLFASVYMTLTMSLAPLEAEPLSMGQIRKCQNALATSSIPSYTAIQQICAIIFIFGPILRVAVETG